ncbi:unnamed protein product [Protopolystoma xenopodis]|uniref:Guanylate kinase/L-type calcium channel beta subunit domain-containing protein n=1 Tax=Protopolystoma xenopodis TaxID=117903 RepID=A0A448XLW0_9PLAT|nr:unnamed protein product [Protopolystoma xenopodis]
MTDTTQIGLQSTDVLPYETITKVEFETRRDRHDFVEWGVFNSAFYGTSRQSIDSLVQAGKVCCLALRPDVSMSHKCCVKKQRLALARNRLRLMDTLTMSDRVLERMGDFSLNLLSQKFIEKYFVLHYRSTENLTILFILSSAPNVYTPQSVRAMRNTGLLPYVIFISPPERLDEFRKLRARLGETYDCTVSYLFSFIAS